MGMVDRLCRKSFISEGDQYQQGYAKCIYLLHPSVGVFIFS